MPRGSGPNLTQHGLSGCGGREQRPEVTTTTFKFFAAYRPAGGTFLNNRCRVSALLMEVNLTKVNECVKAFLFIKVNNKDKNNNQLIIL
ncbi:hypothetical protein, partial [Serratia marcescens]|uniref:hypothetical protein n=1 Tax=Serratia marcescens TaxID=615 RepID=UPI001CA44C80